MQNIDVRKSLKKYIPILVKANEDKLNEAEIVVRLLKVFEEVLGYDPFEEISREMAIKDKFADFALKIDGKVEILVEAKSGGTTLRDRHLEQAKHYAANGNVNWVVLTNGVEWILYHLTFDEGINYDKAFSINLTTDPLDTVCVMIAILQKKSVQSGGLESFWEHKIALSPESISRVLFTEDVLTLMRRELKKLKGVRVEEEDLAEAIHSLFSLEAREHVGPLRIHRKRKTHKAEEKVALGGNLEEVLEQSKTEKIA